MEEAERADGWLDWCERAGVYVVASREFAAQLAELLQGLPQPLLEVAAGNGVLAALLTEYGLPVIATDPKPVGANVIGLDARDALLEYRPATVLACFPPLDAGIEECVLHFESVQDFVYIGPLIHERPGPDGLWQVRGWRSEILTRINNVLLTRLDYLADFTRATHQRRASAVRFRHERPNPPSETTA